MSNVTATIAHGERPGFLRWCAYALGAGVPQRCHEWVLFDTTSRTWVLRHLARAMFQLLVPIAVFCVFIPGPAWIRVAMVIAGTFMGLIWSVGYISETNDHRLVKAGYPTGYGERLRSERAVLTQNTSNAARRERIAARRARHGH